MAKTPSKRQKRSTKIARSPSSAASRSSSAQSVAFPSAASIFEPFQQIQNQIQEMFSGGFRPFAFENMFKDFEPFKAFACFQPAVNVTEDKDSYKVVACVPAVSPENVEVCVGDNCVTISSKSESRETGKSKGMNYSTWSTQSFYRSIPLPEVANTAKAEADFAGGILTICVPKRGGSADKARKIPIGRKSA